MINIFLKNKLSPIARMSIILINDILLLNFSLYFSYYLRIEYFLQIFLIKNVLVISTIFYLILFFSFKIYKQYFRYFNNNSYKLYFNFFISYGFIFGIYVLLQNDYFIPRSLILIFPSFFFFLIIVNRIIVAKLFQQKSVYNQKKAIVFGFNPANINALLSYANVTCFIDDKKNTKKRIVNGIEIISSNSFIQNYQKIKFDVILIDNEYIFKKVRELIRNHIIEKKIIVQKISFKNNEIITSAYFDFNYFFNRKNKTTPLGDIYKNKNILITGAGGSIGSNIVFQLLKSKYKKLILIDNSEYNLYSLSGKLNKSENISFHLTNFNNKNDIERILSENNIDIIFHAAAFKHVPLIENNPFSAIKNNFLDTYDFMKLIINFNVGKFCLISSDKAVRPTNIMGASKRLSELALCYLNNLKNHNTSLCSVRFGNVINSSGSVKPLFQKQIDNFLPVTLTHKKIIRYFMTIEEAANLVLNTTKISNGGEIFLLDMGEPIKLYDLAKLMIQFSGKTIKKDGYGDIDIKIIGLRKGEKLFEELLVDEKSKQSSVKYIFQSLESKISNEDFLNIYSNIFDSYRKNNFELLKKILKGKFINYASNK